MFTHVTKWYRGYRHESNVSTAMFLFRLLTMNNTTDKWGHIIVLFNK